MKIHHEPFLPTAINSPKGIKYTKATDVIDIILQR
jgi:hypothetical protein